MTKIVSKNGPLSIKNKCKGTKNYYDIRKVELAFQNFIDSYKVDIKPAQKKEPTKNDKKR